ncbi:hypothetical protein [Endozoicomonas acroporae]|nr:hypothetical protein [Endozoicomonas acroporae]
MMITFTFRPHGTLINLIEEFVCRENMGVFFLTILSTDDQGLIRRS